MLSYELREQVLRAIDDELTLAVLEEWIAPRLPLFLEQPDSDDADMIASIEMALAEVAGGVIDEVEARAMLREALERLGNTVAAPTAAEGYVQTVVTGSRNRNLVQSAIGAPFTIRYASRS